MARKSGGDAHGGLSGREEEAASKSSNAKRQASEQENGGQEDLPSRSSGHEHGNKAC